MISCKLVSNFSHTSQVSDSITLNQDTACALCMYGMSYTLSDSQEDTRPDQINLNINKLVQITAASVDVTSL